MLKILLERKVFNPEYKILYRGMHLNSDDDQAKFLFHAGILASSLSNMLHFGRKIKKMHLENGKVYVNDRRRPLEEVLETTWGSGLPNLCVSASSSLEVAKKRAWRGGYIFEIAIDPKRINKVTMRYRSGIYGPVEEGLEFERTPSLQDAFKMPEEEGYDYGEKEYTFLFRIDPKDIRKVFKNLTRK